MSGCRCLACTVAADTPSPSAETTDVNDSGPRLLAITTESASPQCRPRHRLPEPAGADDSNVVSVRCVH